VSGQPGDGGGISSGGISSGRSSVRGREHLAVPESGSSLRARVADWRGLTATGAVGVALGLGLLGGAIDVLTGPGLRAVFAVTFVLGCLLAALLVHEEDLLAAVVMPPLIYVVLALLAGGLEASGAGGGWLRQQWLELATSLVLGAPVLLTATGLAVVVAVARAARAWWARQRPGAAVGRRVAEEALPSGAAVRRGEAPGAARTPAAPRRRSPR
jgi:hypothetical protein